MCLHTVLISSFLLLHVTIMKTLKFYLSCCRLGFGWNATKTPGLQHHPVYRDELTLNGQAESLMQRLSREKSRPNTIFKKIGKLNSISKLGKGAKCPAPFAWITGPTRASASRSSARVGLAPGPPELQMQEGEYHPQHREKTGSLWTRDCAQPTTQKPVRLHFIREGHRYKFVTSRPRQVCCVLRNNKIPPMHFPLHLTVPKFSLSRNTWLSGEGWPETLVHHCWVSAKNSSTSMSIHGQSATWNRLELGP